MKKIKLTDNKSYNLFLIYDSINDKKDPKKAFKKSRKNNVKKADEETEINEDDIDFDLSELEKDEINEDNVDFSEYEGFEKEDYSLIGADCKEFLEAYEKKTDKKDPRYYLILMALGKDKGWAYIKKSDDLTGEVGLDVVTPKNAKKILKESK